MTTLTSNRDGGFVLSKEDRMVTRRSTRLEDREGGEAGFALILAILALLLLTFLGLTIATSTSTELQIATNYRWGQQALYNAEAGLEAAKVILSNPPVADATNGITALPAARGGVWDLGIVSAPTEPYTATRDFENGVSNVGTIGCDRRGGGMGYGRVLNDGAGGVGGVDYENVSTWGGQPLNGTFTIWIRRELQSNAAGQFFDYAADSATAVVTVEGSAPYTDNNAADAFVQANRSVRILETTLTLNQSKGITSCAGMEGQVGQAPQGDNFGCAMLDDTSVGALQP
jgi:hypothetical protein